MAWYLILLIVIAGLLVLSVVGTLALFMLLLRKPHFSEKHARMTKEELALLKSKVHEAKEKYKDVPQEEVFITNDNLKLRGIYYDQHTARSVIIVHGYCASLDSRLMDLPYYYSRGYNVLLVDLRVHGKSEGTYVTLGAKESEDIMAWIEWLNARTNNSRIILDGVSMGSATILNCAGKADLPSNVVGIVADCGFTSPFEQCRYMIFGRNKNKGIFPTEIARFYAKVLCKYDMKKYAPVESVKNAKIPALIIHGDNDDFVPTYMAREIFDAYAGEKDILINHCVGHALSTVLATERVHKKLDEFLDNVMKNSATQNA